MKNSLSKTEARSIIYTFFQRGSFTVGELKKVKRLAMKFNIKLGNYRRRFCKNCLSPLQGKIRVTKAHKTVVCEMCGYANRWRM